MLPDGFEWVPRHQYETDRLALALHGQHIATLTRKLTGEWLAILEHHRPLGQPNVYRDCRTFETGKAGCETWACRHEARLRVEVAAVRAGRRK